MFVVGVAVEPTTIAALPPLVALPSSDAEFCRAGTNDDGESLLPIRLAPTAAENGVLCTVGVDFFASSGTVLITMLAGAIVGVHGADGGVQSGWGRR